MARMQNISNISKMSIIKGPSGIPWRLNEKWQSLLGKQCHWLLRLIGMKKILSFENASKMHSNSQAATAKKTTKKLPITKLFLMTWKIKIITRLVSLISSNYNGNSNRFRIHHRKRLGFHGKNGLGLGRIC